MGSLTFADSLTRTNSTRRTILIDTTGASIGQSEALLGTAGPLVGFVFSLTEADSIGALKTRVFVTFFVWGAFQTMAADTEAALGRLSIVAFAGILGHCQYAGGFCYTGKEASRPRTNLTCVHNAHFLSFIVVHAFLYADADASGRIATRVVWSVRRTILILVAGLVPGITENFDRCFNV
jgi:hypothetical protein